MKSHVTKIALVTGTFLSLLGSAYGSTLPDTDVEQQGDTNKAISVPQDNAAAKAKTEVSGTFDLTTNYMFRGISQSSNLPAAQGGLTVTVPNFGGYLSVWGSSVNFLDPQGVTATTEIDTIAGITNSIGGNDNFTYDVNIDRYNYPKSAASYNEVIANLTYYFLTAQLGFSSNVYNLHGNGTYYNLGINYDIPEKYFFNVKDVNLKAGVGHYSLQPKTGLRSYNDFLLQLSKTIGIYNLALMLTDTNRHSVDANSLKDTHVVGTVTASF